MSTLGFDFDPQKEERQEAFDALPAGWYAVVWSNDEMRANKNTEGSHLFVEYTVDERYHPNLKGRKVFERLNLHNANSQTVAIARKQLASIAHAAGVHAMFNDTSVLRGKVIAIKVTVRQSDEHGAQNDIKGHAPVAERFSPTGQPMSPTQQSASPAQQQQQTPPQAQKPNDSVAPWKR